MTELITIWRQHAKGEKFGEFLYKCVAESGEFLVAAQVSATLYHSDHADLLRMARERFGLEG